MPHKWVCPVCLEFANPDGRRDVAQFDDCNSVLFHADCVEFIGTLAAHERAWERQAKIERGEILSAKLP